MRIDAFAHFLPPELREAVLAEAPPSRDLVNWTSLEHLYDIDRRVDLLDAHDIALQVLTSPSPPLESIFDLSRAQRMAQLANDSMAKLVRARSDRFRGVATLPLAEPSWAVAELRRSVLELGLEGPLVYTHVNGRALDDPQLEPFWDEVEDLGVPVWLHPDRFGSKADYFNEDGSKYGLFLVLGWPYETSVAVTRLVLSGVIARHPNMRVIIHHGGAMIPFFHRRIEMNFQGGGQKRVPDLADHMVNVQHDLRNFYVDTVLQGASAALETAISFYGVDRVLMATDAPFGPDHGAAFAAASIESVQRLDDPRHREAIFSGNAHALLGL